eukprot:gene6365-2993_t
MLLRRRSESDELFSDGLVADGRLCLPLRDAISTDSTAVTGTSSGLPNLWLVVALAAVAVVAIQKLLFSSGQGKHPEGVSSMSMMGQNFNSAGIGLFMKILGSLAIPHLTVPDIRSVRWQALKDAGICGVVFDKDNTLTHPFAMKVDDHLTESVQECK